MKKKPSSNDSDLNNVGQLVGEIIGDAHSDDERLKAFRRFLQERISLPCDGFVIGEPVSIVAFDYDGNERRGLTARCRRDDGSEHIVGAWEVVLPPRSSGVSYLAAYRSWMGLEPLGLEDRGVWKPEEHYWGEEDEPIEAWAKPIVARGPRRQFEMEQIVPGRDPDDFDSDSICSSNDLRDAGDYDAAREILMELCEADLRCLDAHAHLGNFAFKHLPNHAIRHYQVGVRIGELSLPPDFDGLLPWGFIDNRPFLRCMHGLGLCLWRPDRFDEAVRVFDRMLWLNPADNQGVRLLIEDVRAKMAWEDQEEV